MLNLQLWTVCPCYFLILPQRCGVRLLQTDTSLQKIEFCTFQNVMTMQSAALSNNLNELDLLLQVPCHGHISHFNTMYQSYFICQNTERRKVKSQIEIFKAFAYFGQ